MKIAITGGTGFIGSRLADNLNSQGHHVYILTRNPDKYENSEYRTYVGWLKDEFTPEAQLSDLDAIVNLAGESINGRWTKKKKQSILDSRIEATEGILQLIEKLDKKPEVLVNGSAVGFYGNSETEAFTEETTTPGDGFLAEVVSEWESRAAQAEKLGVRTAFLRFGVVLGEEGALPRIAIPYKLMAGGQVGSGEQWMSWIHVDDLIGLIEFALTNKHVTGPVNATAPNPKRNKDFGQILGTVLGRPHWLPAPAFAVKTVLGEMSTLVLDGQHVLPKKAEELGYRFQYPELKQALEEIYVTSA
ncbi:TIGR01777 family oxidoreductase [Thalassobacillus pellis]|uniref:TIGR01777 family oxidoreductase n=1 Tax=Thalassobacillus pellis TaxID=748008 RepID=UPI001960BE98|nr:TIGR01777 family oxidoreductase [Thalassobacillus pellis]MBM7553832.1 uncharacterized protein (TIGR01777 family) [Thalassobacillus pellis]